MQQWIAVVISCNSGIHLCLENSWYEIQYGEVKLTNHCMLNCLRKECIHCCIDSGNFRSCWSKVESSCYQLQLGIHLRLENSWYEIQYGEVKLDVNECLIELITMLSLLHQQRKFPFCWCNSWDTVVISQQFRHSMVWKIVDYEIQYGEVISTNHCTLNCLPIWKELYPLLHWQRKLPFVSMQQLIHSFLRQFNMQWLVNSWPEILYFISNFPDVNECLIVNW